MADRYVYHGGSNTSPYDTWAKAATTMNSALSGESAGDTIWVASDHVEALVSTNIAIAAAGTAASPCRIISVNRAGSVPPVAADVLAGAQVSTNWTAIAFSGHFYCYGITFKATGNGGNNMTMNGGSNSMTFEACAFQQSNTFSGNLIQPGNTTSRVEWINCTVEFSHVDQKIVPAGSFRWSNKAGAVAVTGATFPTQLIDSNGGAYTADVQLVGLDLSASGSGKNIVGDIDNVTLVNCKLNAAVTVASTPTYPSIKGVRVIGCHSAGNVARSEIYRYQGVLTTETTIVRTDGASDGVTPYSWKVVTNANNERLVPFETFEGALWNDATGSSRTLTIHIVTDNVTLTDAEIWLEADYLGSSGSPVATTVSDAPATALTAGANQAASGAAWTTTGLTTPVMQKLEVTFTPQMAGPVRWRVKVGKASTTVYICPKAVLS